MAEIIGSNGLQKGILNSDGVLIKAAFYDLSEELKENQTLRDDVPIPAYVFGDPTQNKYHKSIDGVFVEIPNSTIVSIETNWQSSFPDYKKARVQMYVAMLTVGGFENLSIDEKKIVSKWFLVGRTERNSVHTVDEQIQNGITYNENSIIARKKRLVKCMMEVYNRLNDDEIKQIMKAMKFSTTTYAFTEAGQEGTLEGYDEGLYDYIMARTETQWELTGLRVQNYVPVGFDNCVQLTDRLMDILVNGNY